MPTISTLTVDVETRTSRFSRGLRIVTTGLAAMAAGAAYAFKKFEESEKITRQTEAVLESTGGVANVTAKHVQELASALQRKTGLDDEAIRTGENLLLTFTNIRNEAGKGNDIFDQATKVILDMSVALGQDMKSSAIQVGKALQDPILGLTALRRVGVNFNKEQSEMVAGWVEQGKILKAQKFILQELTTEFGGSAEAQATASGKMKAALGDMAESIGALVAPAIERLADWVTRAAVAFNQLDPGMQTTITTVAALAAGLLLVTKALGGVVAATRIVIATFSLLAAHPVVAVLVAFAAIVALVATRWDKLNGIVKVALSLLSPLGVALGLLIRNWDDVKEAALKAGEAIGNAIRKVIDWIKQAIDWVVDKFGGAWKAVVGPIVGAIGTIINAVQALIGAIGTAISKIGELAGKAGGIAQRGGFGIPILNLIPGLAHGGVVTSPTVAMVGEAGPEAVIPLNQLGMMFGGGGGDVVLQVDGQTLARISRDQLLKLKGSRVSLGLS